MNRRLEGRTALVTGAARGQGRAFAVRLAREGADVILLDVDGGQADGYALAAGSDLKDTAEMVHAEGRRATRHTVDVTDRAGLAEVVEATAAAYPRLDVLVPNAGIVTAAPLAGEPPMWDRVIAVNLTGVYNTLRAFVPRMIDTGGGSIVIAGSVAGLKAMPLFAAYGAAKHGLQGLMETLAVELAEHRIRVNTINPGPVATPMTEGNPGLLERFGSEDPTAALFRTSFAPVLPIDGDWITPEQVADTVAFLASDESRYITGLAVPVDGGIMVR